MSIDNEPTFSHFSNMVYLYLILKCYRIFPFVIKVFVASMLSLLLGILFLFLLFFILNEKIFTFAEWSLQGITKSNLFVKLRLCVFIIFCRIYRHDKYGLVAILDVRLCYAL